MSSPIFVEGCWETPKFVRHGLMVVLSHVMEKSWCHMSLFGAVSYATDQTRSSHLLEGFSDIPHGQNAARKVDKEQEYGLFRRLDLEWVEMKVEFGANVWVKNCVNIFEVVPACILVIPVRFQVGAVEVTASSSGGSRRSKAWSKNGWVARSAQNLLQVCIHGKVLAMFSGVASIVFV